MTVLARSTQRTQGHDYLPTDKLHECELIKANIVQIYTPELTLNVTICGHNLPKNIWAGSFFGVRCEFSQLSLATAPPGSVKPVSYGIVLPGP